jgi:putative transposase
MARGIEGRPVFLADKDRRDLCDRLGKLVPATGSTVYAWSLLDNHLHLFIRSGKAGISKFMRRLLTGYAVSFNHRYRRVGHLFQNRFKSIVVEEEPYLLQLVRYIHLNPLRAGLVTDIVSLEQYPWCGHSALLGRSSIPWQDTEYVLSRFGVTRAQARQQYQQFTEEGVVEGKRPDLVGGGLIRSVGGRAEFMKLGRGRERWAYDERVLGSSDFVIGLLQDYERPCDETRTHPL